MAGSSGIGFDWDFSNENPVSGTFGGSSFAPVYAKFGGISPEVLFIVGAVGFAAFLILRKGK